jgi:hypothetical protein
MNIYNISKDNMEWYKLQIDVWPELIIPGFVFIG